MKKILLLIAVFIITTSYSQKCYTVKNVKNEGEIEGINPNRFLLGVKQITEEILSSTYSICENGKPVSVVIQSIEAPTNSFSLGPFEKKRKKTIVKLVITIDGDDYEGEGEANTDVNATFIELQDENLPFEKSAFSGALKKGLQDAISKI
jgi:hypothetical protein